MQHIYQYKPFSNPLNYYPSSTNNCRNLIILPRQTSHNFYSLPYIFFLLPTYLFCLSVSALDKPKRIYGLKIHGKAFCVQLPSMIFSCLAWSNYSTKNQENKFSSHCADFRFPSFLRVQLCKHARLFGDCHYQAQKAPRMNFFALRFLVQKSSFSHAPQQLVVNLHLRSSERQTKNFPLSIFSPRCALPPKWELSSGLCVGALCHL